MTDTQIPAIDLMNELDKFMEESRQEMLRLTRTLIDIKGNTESNGIALSAPFRPISQAFRRAADVLSKLGDIAPMFDVDGVAFIAAARFWWDAANSLDNHNPLPEEFAKLPIVAGSELRFELPARIKELKHKIYKNVEETAHARAFEAAYAEAMKMADRLTNTKRKIQPARSRDNPKLKAMTPNEQALFDVLNDEGQTGPDLIAKLLRDRIEFSESKISKICKRPHMRARGVRHRKGAGYYVMKSNSKARAS